VVVAINAGCTDKLNRLHVLKRPRHLHRNLSAPCRRSPC